MASQSSGSQAARPWTWKRTNKARCPAGCKDSPARSWLKARHGPTALGWGEAALRQDGSPSVLRTQLHSQSAMSQTRESSSLKPVTGHSSGRRDSALFLVLSWVRLYTPWDTVSRLPRGQDQSCSILLPSSLIFSCCLHRS